MDYRKGIAVNGVLLLLLCAAGLGLLRPSGPAAQAEKAPLSTPVLEHHVADIAAVALVRGDVRFGLLHQDGEIFLEPQTQATELSQERLQSFLYRLSKLTALRQITPSADSGESYGMDRPLARNTVILRDGRKIRMTLGKQNPLDNSYYLQVEGRENLYILSEEDGNLLQSAPSDFLSRRILPEVDLKELNTLDYLQLTSAEGDFRIENRGDFVFFLTDPISNTVDYETILSDLIFPLLSLTPGKAEEPQTPLPAVPEAAVRIGIAGKAYELQFFPRPGGGLYLTSRGFPGVYLLAEAPRFLGLGYTDLLNGSVYHTNISEVQGILIQDRISGRDYNIDLAGQAVQLQGRINGRDRAYPEMMDFFSVLLNTGLARELEGERQLDEESPGTMSILIYKKNGGTDRLDFLPSDKGEQILYINGTAHFTTYTKTVLDIQDALAVLMEKEGV